MVNVYRAKAFECLSLAEWVNPEERAEMVRFARVWMSFAEPIAEARGAYELPRRRPVAPSRRWKVAETTANLISASPF